MVYINYRKTCANKTNKCLLKIDKIVYKLDKLLMDFLFYIYSKPKGFRPLVISTRLTELKKDFSNPEYFEFEFR